LIPPEQELNSTTCSGGTVYCVSASAAIIILFNGYGGYFSLCSICSCLHNLKKRHFTNSPPSIVIKHQISQQPANMATQPPPNSILVTLKQVAKMIDHSLLHPTMTDAEILDGLRIAKKYDVATVCIKPYLTPLAKKELEGTDVLICAVIGFPHGNSTTEIKILEAEAAVAAGGKEIDMVINIGKALGGDWTYVAEEIRHINSVVIKHGAILKVIFENDYLREEHIVKLCKICSAIGVGFVKTSTGYGFIKLPNGFYTYVGATIPHLKLMRNHTASNVQIKAAGGVRTLDDMLHVMSLGVTRIGATATIAIMEAALGRGLSEVPLNVEFIPMATGSSGGY
jgi:deoxyribose-phosphate aldolase